LCGVDPNSGQVVIAQRAGCVAAAMGIIQCTEGSAFVEMLSISLLTIAVSRLLMQLSGLL